MIAQLSARKIQKGMWVCWSVVGLAFLAFAPTTWAAEDKFAQVHRIGIIAALGDRIEIWAHGWADKDSHDGFRAIDGKRLDDLTTQTAAQLIGNRFEVVPITYESQSFIVPDMGPASEDLPSIKNLILALPPSGIDAYLVIRKRTWHLTSLYVMDGITATRSALVGSRNLFVTLQVDLVDSKTGKTLAARFLPLMTGIKREDWAETPEQMTDAQAQDLERRIADLITRSLPGALAAMGLTGPQTSP